MAYLYTLSPDGKTVTFHIPVAAYPKTPVYLCGTFTKWKQTAIPFWEFTPGFDLNGNPALILKQSYPFIHIPGNCGYPEFNFFTSSEGHSCPWNSISGANSQKDLYTFMGNYAILPPGESEQAFLAAAKEAETVKTLSSFLPLTDKNKEIISNFRKVPGTQNLFRSYHPYKKSFPQFDTENTRSDIVKELVEKNGIRSIISLCGSEQCDESLGERISAYQQKIIDEGNEFFTDISYENVYYSSDSRNIGDVFGDIIRFIATNPAPYLVHCRLGSDRTGVICALLAALCGALWSDIAEDYEKTGRMGIQQYRDSRLLKYAVDNFAGTRVHPSRPFARTISLRCIKNGYATQEEINAAVNNLKG